MPEQDTETGRLFAAEAIGTAVLVLGGCGTAILATGAFGQVTVGVLGVATAFGLSLLILAYAIGGISGCHVNPAVTLGMVLAGRMKIATAGIYWLAQAVGGLIGGLILYATVKASGFTQPPGFASNGFGQHSPGGFKLGSVAIIEIVMTALLVLVVLSTTHPKFPAGFGGLAVGGTLWLIHLISIPVSNTSVNPARSLAVAPFAAETWPLQQLWAFIVFPLAGAVVGAALWMVVGGTRPGTSGA